MAKSNTVRPKKGRGRPSLAPDATGRSPTITIRLPEPLIDGLDKLAEERGISRSDVMRHLVEQKLAAQAKAKKGK